ncbi:MAG: hypothetical protein GX159_09800 [Flavobacteriaceae bacterium]|jgi:hypothetical protein|nr:hypothetical protein [Flavobacteriaceae bacterium]
MDWKVVLLLAFVLCGCVTKKKAVDISKKKTAVTEQLQSEETSKSDVQAAAQSSSLTAYDFRQFFGDWEMAFNGQQVSDGLRLYMKQTESGFEAGAEGIGTATASGIINQENSETKADWKAEYTALIAQMNSKFIDYEARIENLEKEKKVQKELTGFQAGVYILGGIVLMLLIFIVWVEWRMRKISKTVRPFLKI